MKWKKFLFLIVLLSVTCLMACQQGQRAIVFHREDFTTFSYQQRSYTILNQKVDVSELDRLELRFLHLEVMGEDKRNKGTSLSVQNLYRIRDGGLCIGIQDDYYRVKPSDELVASDERWKPAVSGEDGLMIGETFRINHRDARMIDGGGHHYRVTNTLVSEEELDEFVTVLAEVVLFRSDTGQRIPSSRWGAMDWTGQDAKEKRDLWTYGSIYTVKEHSAQDVLAIEVNDAYHLAIRE
ncbi:NisI/SpaI family lantibiotic immunity lipoprotein [Streptococcus cuniculi]|uniref:NisI/SpaI family lantibiotic immunity lipoprotein n=1 Tax=Streptococcus cuniculi TaxID=1432788 RepID=A0A4Y9JAA3_9STRE|nr:NisI/SpaI family lantibiotic immunity lipoprotein [Streptococcus cuniculi]MBF0779163.1 NisI/SpaI family lantibiotic immunity lipoprotein [Streptococcus cuniculi]TFU96889.1 NisI/SpaI family lantibiotic immunity lipoprotein [Streptococcus cuniculi]